MVVLQSGDRHLLTENGVDLSDGKQKQAGMDETSAARSIQFHVTGISDNIIFREKPAHVFP